MRRFVYTVLISAVVLGHSKSTFADIYKFIDSAGHVFYTDRPSHAGYRRIIRSPVTIVPSLITQSKTARSGLASSTTRTASPFLERKRQNFAGLINAAANKYRLDPALLHAVIRAESAYNPNAVSVKGAAGLMQLMPATATRYGVRDRLDPVENIEGGARYLSDLLDMFQSDVRLAVAAYNSGENNVIRHGYQVPPFQETRDYVVRVLDYYRRMN
jgi:soluble lytic murein transglycosylase-like protein